MREQGLRATLGPASTRRLTKTKTLATVAAAGLVALTLVTPVSAAIDGAVEGRQPCPLAGTWTLVAADKELPDGRRVADYGTAPAGLLSIDSRGRYSLQIFKRERPFFASGDKPTGTAVEFREAVLGSSTHFGLLEVDADGGFLVFKIEDASFPNWNGTEQRRTYTLTGDLLAYRVPPRPDGSIPISVWRRLK
jgi:hypothetical protein